MRNKRFRVPAGVIGDLNISWDKDSEEDVREAEQLFEELKEKKYKFVALIGGKLKKITKFDKNADQLLVISPVKPGC